MRIGRRLNKWERREMQQQKLKNDMSGTGLFIYENNTDGDLTLPKPTATGLRVVNPRKQFQGDSYYKKWVGPPLNLLKYVKEIVPERQENIMAEPQKLLLDQPDTVTTKGKVEHVVADQPVQALNDNVVDPNKKPDVLLTEDPLDGVEIILG